MHNGKFFPTVKVKVTGVRNLANMALARSIASNRVNENEWRFLYHEPLGHPPGQ